MYLLTISLSTVYGRIGNQILHIYFLLLDSTFLILIGDYRHSLSLMAIKNRDLKIFSHRLFSLCVDTGSSNTAWKKSLIRVVRSPFLSSSLSSTQAERLFHKSSQLGIKASRCIEPRVRCVIHYRLGDFIQGMGDDFVFSAADCRDFIDFTRFAFKDASYYLISDEPYNEKIVAIKKALESAGIMLESTQDPSSTSDWHCIANAHIVFSNSSTFSLSACLLSSSVHTYILPSRLINSCDPGNNDNFYKVARSKAVIFGSLSVINLC